MHAWGFWPPSAPPGMVFHDNYNPINVALLSQSAHAGLHAAESGITETKRQKNDVSMRHPDAKPSSRQINGNGAAASTQLNLDHHDGDAPCISGTGAEGAIVPTGTNLLPEKLYHASSSNPDLVGSTLPLLGSASALTSNSARPKLARSSHDPAMASPRGQAPRLARASEGGYQSLQQDHVISPFNTAPQQHPGDLGTISMPNGHPQRQGAAGGEGDAPLPSLSRASIGGIGGRRVTLFQDIVRIAQERQFNADRVSVSSGCRPINTA